MWLELMYDQELFNLKLKKILMLFLYERVKKIISRSTFNCTAAYEA